MKLVVLAVLVLHSLAALAVNKQDVPFMPAAPVRLQDFENLGISTNKSLGFKAFAKNAGLALSKDSSIHNILYTSANFKKWVFVQANMAIGDKAEGSITTLPDKKSYFFVRGPANFFILAKGLERDELFKLQKDILKNVSDNSKNSAQIHEAPSQKWIFAEMLLRTQTSYAASKCLSSEDIQKTLVTNTESDFDMDKCAHNGAWNATGGILETTANVFTKGSEQLLCFAAGAVDNVSGSNISWHRCSEYAEAMHKTADTTMYAIGNIKQVTGELIDGFGDLPGPVRLQILCEIGSTAATGVAVTFYTRGAGAPVVLTRLSEVLDRVAEMPGMSKSAARLKAMAAKLDLEAKAKAVALANVKALPSEIVDIKESLAKIERNQKELVDNSQKLELASGKLDTKILEVDNNLSRVATQDALTHAGARLTKIITTGLSTVAENKELARFFLKYAKLTDSEIDLAKQILNSENKDDIMKLGKAIRDKRISGKLEVRDDVTFATPEHFARIATEQGTLSYQRTQALKAYNKSKDKVSDEISHYFNLIEKKNISVEDKNILRAQVSTYMTTALCNAAGGARESGSVQKADGVQ